MNPSRKGLSYIRLGVITWTIIALVVHSASAMADEQGVVVLGTEQDIRKDDDPRCLENAIKEAEPERKIITASQFRNALFPFFEPDTAPKSVQELSIVLGKSKVQQGIKALGVRYLVVASGQTSSSSYEGAGVGSMYGFYGGGVGDRTTDMAVLIWDLQNVDSQKSVDVSATGKNILVGFVLPIPILANTKQKACKMMAEQVSSFMQNENMDTAIPMSVEEFGPDPGDIE